MVDTGSLAANISQNPAVYVRPRRAGTLKGCRAEPVASGPCASRPAADPLTLDDDLIIAGDNLPVLERLPADAFDLIYIDPPFNTGRVQTRRSVSSDRR